MNKFSFGNPWFDCPRWIIFAIISVFISGCGFHLRGSGPNQIIGDYSGTKIYLGVTSQDNALKRQIKLDLQLANFLILNDVEKTPNHLIVLKTDFDKRAVGTDKNGRDNEFEITQLVEFIINNDQDINISDSSNKNKSKSLDFDNQVVRAHRSFYFDNNDPIGKLAEENSLIDSMRRELSRKIINHLMISLNKTKSIDKEMRPAQ